MHSCRVVLNSLCTVRVFLLVLLQALFSACVTAAEPLTIHCQFGERLRVIEVIYPEKTELPCEVVYRKNDVEKILWRASNSEGYCLARAREFALKQESWGWLCEEEVTAVISEGHSGEAAIDLGEETQVSLYDDSISLQGAADKSQLPLQQDVENTESAEKSEGAAKVTAEVEESGKPADQRLIQRKKILPPSYWVGAAFQYEYSRFDGLLNASDNGIQSSDYGFRRAELSIRKQVFDWGEAKAQIDIEGERVKDFYFRYVGQNPKSRLTVGNQKEPLSLDNLSSSKFASASEVSIATSGFVLPRNLGLQYNILSEDLLWGVGLFTGALGEHFDSNDDFQRALSGRVSKGFQLTETVGMHLGLGASSRHGQFDAVTVKPEDHWVDRLTVVELDAQSSRVANVEAAITVAGLSVQGEWFDGVYEGDSGGRAQSHYLQASYFLGGQSRVYRPDFGVFGPVSVNKNDWMVLEFFARHSVLSASNDRDDKNRLDSNSVGVNWFPGSRVRLSLEYGVVRSDEQISTVDDGERLNGRIQFLY